MLGRALLLAVPLLLVSSPQRPAQTPEEGTRVRRELTISSALAMESATVTVAGEEQPMDDEELTEFQLDLRVLAVDTFGASKDGVLLGLKREFKELEMDYEVDADTGEIDGIDALELETVGFSRASADDEWTKKFIADEGEATPDPDVLRGLWADMDATALLPAKDVEVDGTWSAAGAGLRALFLPGGLPIGRGHSGEIASLLLDEIFPAVAGSQSDFVVECTWRGVADGIGEIEFSYSGSGEFEASETILALFGVIQGNDPDEAPDDLVADVTMDFEGKGTLLWNMAAGRLQQLDMELGTDLEIDMTFSQDWGDESVELSVVSDLRGEVTWKLTGAAVE